MAARMTWLRTLPMFALVLFGLAACPPDRPFAPDGGIDQGAYPASCDFSHDKSCTVEGELCQDGSLNQFICHNGQFGCYDPEHGCQDFAMPGDLASRD
jgi:hypothetical protein